MAFHQPTRQWTQRLARPAAEEERDASSQDRGRQDQPLEESQTWVLFSPVTEASTTSYLSETEQSLETPGRSRISDLGSSNTVARWNRQDGTAQSGSLSVIEDESTADDAELDSLDSHLPEFRSLPGVSPAAQQESHHGLTVLPSHDGLGSFRLDRPAINADAQDQIYRFEQFNPRRIQRRRESFDRATLELEHEHAQEQHKRDRIEAWRLEQSRILLDEVQRETRRRRKSQASLQRAHGSVVDARPTSRHGDAESDNATWHDEEAMDQPSNSEGFIARLTRTVIQDLLGLDDKMLSILLGESLPDEADLSSTPRASQLGGMEEMIDPSSWQTHMLERVSKELGLLVNHMSHHPGAFSTYTRMQQMPLPYAGLPVIPESSSAPQATEAISAQEQSHVAIPEFRPTVQQHGSQNQAQPIEIPHRQKDSITEGAERKDVNMGNTFTKEEWEQDLDIKMVFRYLRSRFLSRSTTPPTSSGSYLSAATGPQDVAAKVARVRQHHPLISRSRPIERRTFKVSTPGSPVAMRHASSCASQSTRRSARRSSVSSRHYWDIGGSLGTGSMIASNGPMGSWGEV